MTRWSSKLPSRSHPALAKPCCSSFILCCGSFVACWFTLLALFPHVFVFTYFIIPFIDVKYGRIRCESPEVSRGRREEMYQGLPPGQGSFRCRRRCHLPGGWAGNGLALVPRGALAVPEDRQGMAHPPGGARALPTAKRALTYARWTSKILPGGAGQRARHRPGSRDDAPPRRRVLPGRRGSGWEAD